jgi:hypothetical protein
VNATTDTFKDNFNMYSYVTEELPALAAAELPIDISKVGLELRRIWMLLVEDVRQCGSFTEKQPATSTSPPPLFLTALSNGSFYSTGLCHLPPTSLPPDFPAF